MLTGLVTAARAMHPPEDHVPIEYSVTEPHDVVRAYMMAVDRGELRIFGLVLDQSMIIPEQVEYLMTWTTRHRGSAFIPGCGNPCRYRNRRDSRRAVSVRRSMPVVAFATPRHMSGRNEQGRAAAVQACKIAYDARGMAARLNAVTAPPEQSPAG